MTEWVIDASAVLADLKGETGGEIAHAAVATSHMSAVNYAEVITKLIENGADPYQASEIASKLQCVIADADKARASRAGLMHTRTRGKGVSLADRFCIALAEELGVPVLTADRLWKTLDIDVEVSLIR
jgi:PIN domain nuclease of toxin-antitoxin system